MHMFIEVTLIITDWLRALHVPFIQACNSWIQSMFDAEGNVIQRQKTVALRIVVSCASSFDKKILLKFEDGL